MKRVLLILFAASALSAHGQIAKDFYNSGNKKFVNANHDFAGAILDYDKAIELDPKYIDAYFSRGSANYMLGNYSASINDYSKVIELNPKHIDAYYYRGYAKKNFSDGIRRCNQRFRQSDWL